MSERFAGMKKIPAGPAARMLAVANAKLETELDLPVSADVEAVLSALEEQGAIPDMLRLLSVALPPRERVWWACLAARDVIGPDAGTVPAPLAAAEAWVFKPGDDTHAGVHDALLAAETDDDTTHAALCALYHKNTLGPDELSEMDAPTGASETTAFVMNIIALDQFSDAFDEYANKLIDRGVDIARGGNGRLDAEGKKTGESAGADNPEFEKG